MLLIFIFSYWLDFSIGTININRGSIAVEKVFDVLVSHSYI